MLSVASGAERSAAQRAHATHARQRHSARTCTCVVHSRAVCLEGPPARHVLRPLVCRLFVWCRSPSGFLRCLPRLGITCGSTWLRCASAAFWLLSSCCGCTYGTGTSGGYSTDDDESSPGTVFDGTTLFFSDGSFFVVCYGSQCGRRWSLALLFSTSLSSLSASGGTPSFGSRSFVHD